MIFYNHSKSFLALNTKLLMLKQYFSGKE